MHNFFRESIVAFIDILGFSEINKDKSEENILKIAELLTSFRKKNSVYAKVPYSKSYWKDAFKFNVSSYSDNIIISHPMEHSDLDQNELLSEIIWHLLHLLSELQIEALLKGYCFRGSISYGSIYIDLDNNIIFGNSLIKAIKSEARVANYPRVILSKSILDKNRLIQSSFSHFKPEEDTCYLFPASSVLDRDFDGMYFCDYLTGYIANAYRERDINKIIFLRDKILTGIEKSQDDLGKLSKWYWLANYFDKHIDYTSKCFDLEGIKFDLSMLVGPTGSFSSF